MFASERLIAAFNAQIGHEMGASMQYIAIAAYFDSASAAGARELLRPPGGRRADARDEIRQVRGRRRRPGGDPGDRRVEERFHLRRGGGAARRSSGKRR